jgi:ABC-type antimicrobial peptide transport system permease subunit
MFIRSAINSLGTDTGYDTRRVAALDLRFPEWLKYPAERRKGIVAELRARLALVPGVDTVTSAWPPDDNRSRAMLENGQPIQQRSVQANYFETLGIPLVLGRSFAAEGSAIISESAARQLWPNQNPIDRTLRLKGPGGSAYKVSGVARDVRGAGLDGSDSRLVYTPLADDKLQDYPILIRAQSDPAQFIEALGPLVSSIDPNLIASATTLEDMLRRSPSFVISSFAAAFASVVGVLGLLLASMGIYGTVSYVVVLRTREVGIRMAIGAQKRDILGLILRESTRAVLAGLAGGVLIALGVSYLLRGLLFGLEGIDGISFFGASALFLAAALLAAYWPSRRAMRVDPMVALRYE